MDQIRALIQQRIVAADGHKRVVQVGRVPQKADFHFIPCGVALHTLGNGQDPVGLHERGDHAASPAQRRGDQLSVHLAETHADIFPVFQTGNHSPGQYRGQGSFL